LLDVWELAAIVLINGVIDCLLVAWLAGKRSKQALVAYLESDQSDEMFDNVFKRFWTRLTTPSIKTGKKVVEKDEAGAILKESDEVISPLDNIASELSRWVILKLRSSMGGKSKAFNDAVATDLADPNSPLASSLGGLFPQAMRLGRKGGSEGLMGMIEQLGLGPIIQKYISKKLEDSLGGIGGEGKW